MLSSERPVGMAGLSPIPHSKIVEFGVFYGYSLQEIDFLVAVIMALDTAHRNLIHERDSKNPKATTN